MREWHAAATGRRRGQTELQAGPGVSSAAPAALGRERHGCGLSCEGRVSGRVAGRYRRGLQRSWSVRERVCVCARRRVCVCVRSLPHRMCVRAFAAASHPKSFWLSWVSREGGEAARVEEGPSFGSRRVRCKSGREGSKFWVEEGAMRQPG